jgi:hypothetical protein
VFFQPIFEVFQSGCFAFDFEHHVHTFSW